MPDLGFGLGALGIGVVLGLTIALIAGWIGGKRPSRVAGAATPGRAIHRAQNRLDRDRLRAERKVAGERGYSQAAAVVGRTSTRPAIAAQAITPSPMMMPRTTVSIMSISWYARGHAATATIPGAAARGPAAGR